MIYLHVYLHGRGFGGILGAGRNDMPQISLYIDEPTLEKVESAASREHVSISKWVADQLRIRLEPAYPKDFEALFGCLGDTAFVRPTEIPLAMDSVRETL
jgi:hypothetical protein